MGNICSDVEQGDVSTDTRGGDTVQVEASYEEVVDHSEGVVVVVRATQGCDNNVDVATEASTSSRIICQEEMDINEILENY